MPGGGQLTSNKNILPCRIQILFANIYQTIERNIFAVYKTPIICIKQNWWGCFLPQAIPPITPTPIDTHFDHAWGSLISFVWLDLSIKNETSLKPSL